MAISFRKYIDINSRVGGATIVAARELIGRIMTENVLLPTDSFVEFTDAAEVGAFFGLTSEEYYRALWYFSFTSKQNTVPQKISFARWNLDDVAPMIIGGKCTKTLDEFKAISTGGMTLTIGSHTADVQNIDLTGAASFAAVAALIQTAIRAVTAGGTAWTAATVTYDSANVRFVLTGGLAAGIQPISAYPVPPQADLVLFLNWAEGISPTTAARWSDGAFGKSPAAALQYSVEASDNFGSFMFLSALSLEEITDVGLYNRSLNVTFMYIVPVILANVGTWYPALEEIAGIALTLVVGNEDRKFPDMIPMVVLASTDYTRADASQNYMFQQALCDPSVTLTEVSDGLDQLRVNYYGLTQKAGRQISFYQRGKMLGMLASDPIDMNVYANEMWLKDRIGAELMNLLLVLGKISANAQGRGTILAGVQVGVQEALNNGVISLGKPLTALQKAYITNITSSSDAWHQVQNSGYWLDCVIVPVDTLGGTEWEARYTLVYSKDDAIRKVVGSHVLI